MLISTYISLATTNTNREILIDSADYELIKGRLWMESTQGYAASTTKPDTYMHRFIMADNSSPYIDHINHNRLDNRRCNLRGCTNSQNQMNRQLMTNASSKYKGVSLTASRGTWRAEIYKDRKRYTLGSFLSEGDAALAYNEKALELYGDFALLNVIEGLSCS